MGRKQGPRKGSLQFWPRKRAEKLLPSVNWKPVNIKATGKTNLLGFIGYKVGMASAFVKDNSPDSMTKNKRIIVPITIIECPPMKILSVRLYKNGIVAREILGENLDKDLKRAIRMPKNKINAKEMLDKIKPEEFDDIRVIAYSDVKKTKIKKTPDIGEIALSGTKEEKLEFVKAHIGKEFIISEVFPKGIVDIRGVTKGKGFQGAIKRFGARLRFHKSEKGVRRIGSVGPWHPTGIRFRVPMAGQMGFHTRICMNSSIVASKKLEDSDPIKNRVFPNYGVLNTDYALLAGSVQGSQKRQVMLTFPIRSSKKQAKKNYELIEIR